MRTRPKQQLPDDVAILQGPTADGAGARILRLRKGALFAGEVRPAREGQPIGRSELVRLKPLAGHAPVCEVEVVHAPAQDAAAAAADRGHGPARIATDRYRRNWGQVFAARRAKASRDLALN